MMKVLLMIAHGIRKVLVWILILPMRGVRKKVFAWRITKCLDLENAIQAKRKQNSSKEVIKLSPATV